MSTQHTLFKTENACIELDEHSNTFDVDVHITGIVDVTVFRSLTWADLRTMRQNLTTLLEAFDELDNDEEARQRAQAHRKERETGFLKRQAAADNIRAKLKEIIAETTTVSTTTTLASLLETAAVQALGESVFLTTAQIRERFVQPILDDHPDLVLAVTTSKR